MRAPQIEMVPHACVIGGRAREHGEHCRRVPATLVCGVLLLALLFRAEAADASDNSERETEHARGAAFASFLKSCALRASDIYFDRELTLYGAESARMLLASSKETQYLAALSEDGGFVYVQMPWRARGDLLEARVVDLAGDRRQALVFRYREHRGGGDMRQVLGIWRVPSEKHIRRVFAAEVGRTTGADSIENKVRFVRRGRARDLVIEATSAKGSLAANPPDKESSSDAVLPILLPGSAKRHVRYQFVGDQYLRSQ